MALCTNPPSTTGALINATAVATDPTRAPGTDRYQVHHNPSEPPPLANNAHPYTPPLPHPLPCTFASPIHPPLRHQQELGCLQQAMEEIKEGALVTSCSLASYERELFAFATRNGEEIFGSELARLIECSVACSFGEMRASGFATGLVVEDFGELHMRQARVARLAAARRWSEEKCPHEPASMSMHARDLRLEASGR